MRVHPYHVHLKNKYPGGEVYSDENSIDAYDAKGVHRVALRKNGHGQLLDVSAQLGLPDVFDLSPIPKETRAFKLFADGSCKPSEEYAERIEKAFEIADAHNGCVPDEKVCAAFAAKKEAAAAEEQKAKSDAAIEKALS